MKHKFTQAQAYSGHRHSSIETAGTLTHHKQLPSFFHRNSSNTDTPHESQNSWSSWGYDSHRIIMHRTFTEGYDTHSITVYWAFTEGYDSQNTTMHSAVTFGFHWGYNSHSITVYWVFTGGYNSHSTTMHSAFTGGLTVTA